MNPHTLEAPASWHPVDVLNELTELARGALTIVEVGTWLGHSALALAQGTPGRVYCVDHWRGSKVGTGVVDDPLDFYARFLDRIRPEPASDRIVPLYGDSQAIAHLFDQHPIDLLYIDGDHAYESVTADLKAWAHLVKPGGIVCGDDYSEVKRAVVDFFPVPLYVVELLVGKRLWAVRV